MQASLARTLEPIVPLPHDIPGSSPKTELGDLLFHDPRLSRDGTVSCASCHPLELGGTDRRQVSAGVGGANGLRNAPTVFNSVFNTTQFWDGRARTLNDQVDGPIVNPVEMATTWRELLKRLGEIPDYRERFGQVYPDGITRANVKDAISSFEATLVTPDAPIDRYLAGEEGAISENARKGYALFKSYGCASCHQGVNVGGNMFQRFGVMGDYFATLATTDDLGRHGVTGIEEDRFVFKVPSLRNVAVTPPYFHDGSVATLDEAVTIMARYQLGREISDSDRALMVEFLDTLTGQYRGRPLK